MGPGVSLRLQTPQMRTALYLGLMLGELGCGQHTVIDLSADASPPSGDVAPPRGGATAVDTQVGGADPGLDAAGGSDTDTSRDCDCDLEQCIDASGRLPRFRPVNAGGVVPWDMAAAFEGEFTLETWVYTVSTRGNMVLNKLTGGAEDIVMGIPGGIPNAYSWVGTSSTKLTGTTALTTETWHHVALVHTAEESLLFVDGERAASATQGGLARDALAPLYIGGSQRVVGFDGYLTGVRFSKGARYSEPFTPDPQPSSDAATLGLWYLREGTGAVLCDSGPFGMHGTAEGLEWELAPSLP